MRNIKVYVGGSSGEIARNKATQTKLGHMGISVVSTWGRHVEKAGEANPVNVSDAERLACAYSDLYELEEADWLLLLMPPVGMVSAGAFLEFGYALARGIKVCISGPGQTASIFTSMADLRVGTDDEAMSFFAKIAG